MALTYNDLRGMVDAFFVKFPFLTPGHVDYKPHTGASEGEMLAKIQSLESQFPGVPVIDTMATHFFMGFFLPKLTSALQESFGLNVNLLQFSGGMRDVLYDGLGTPLPQAEVDGLFEIYRTAATPAVLFNGVLLEVARTGELYPPAIAVKQMVADTYQGMAAWPGVSTEIPWLASSTVDFLAAIYIGAFQRAPEHEGMVYWAGEVARMQKEGASTHEALTGVASMIYDAGNNPDNPNPEIGYDLSNADYVNHVYNNALGRAADDAGYAYWLGQLEGGVPRQHLLHAVLDAALKPGNSDAAYLQARLAVAKYVAQEEVTGPGKPLHDLYQVLGSVSNQASAGDAIVHLMNGGFLVPANAAKLAEAPEASEITGAEWLALLDESHDATAADELPAVESDAGIVLVGVAEAETQPLLG